MVPLILLQIQLAILCFWSWRGVERKEIHVGKGQRQMFIKTKDEPHRGIYGGSFRLAPALHSLNAATSVKQICIQQTPKARLSTKRNEARTMFHTWGRIKVNWYTDWQRMVKRCETRTVLGMLNHAAQKFIFMLEKNYHGFGGTCPLCPPMDPPLITRSHCLLG